MENKIQEVNRLHRRHTAKILTKLKEINAAEIIIDAVKMQFSHYSNDIKDQVLTGNFKNNDKFNR
jgi:CHASE2 domain-containing sensor protein